MVIEDLVLEHNYPYQLRVAAVLILATSCEPKDIVHLYQHGSLPASDFKRRTEAYDAMPGLLAEIALILCEQHGVVDDDLEPGGDGEEEGQGEGDGDLAQAPPVPEAAGQEAAPPSPSERGSDTMSERTDVDSMSMSQDDDAETDVDDALPDDGSGEQIKPESEGPWSSTAWPKEHRDRLKRALDRIHEGGPPVQRAKGVKRPRQQAEQGPLDADQPYSFSSSLRNKLQRSAKE